MNEKHYNLRFLSLFEDDLNEIVDYMTYRLRNPAAAERLVDDVEAAILERLPCAESFEPFHLARERQYPYYRIPPIQGDRLWHFGSLPAGMKKELLPPPNQVMEAVLSVFTHSNSFVHPCRRPI